MNLSYSNRSCKRAHGKQYWSLLLVLYLVCYACSAEYTALVDNILALQVTKTCESDITKNFKYDGGGSYFNYKFSSLRTVVKSQLEALASLTYDKDTEVRKADVQRSSNAIKAADLHGASLDDIQIVFGELDNLYYCYNGMEDVFKCSSSHTSIYTTSIEKWSYRYDCDGWRALYTVPKLVVRGVSVYKLAVMITLNVQNVDINQCPDSSDPSFADTDLCMNPASKCNNIEGQGFLLGSYECICTNCDSCSPIPGARLVPPDANVTYLISGHCGGELIVETTTNGDSDNFSSGKKNTSSVAQHGLRNCAVSYTEEEDCSVFGSKLEIYILLGLQALCLLMCIAFAITVLVYKSTQVIQSAKCMVLLLILFGAALIYSTLALRYFPVSELICFLLPWFREVGFICLYGAITLKTYKVLAEFQTRKARRVHIRDKDMLKYWFVCLGITIVYLAGWTAANINYSAKQGLSLVKTEVSSQGGHQLVCIITGWNYVTCITELIFLAFGLYMSYRLRSAPSMFWEARYFAAALAVEFVISLAYYIISFLMDLNLYWTFILNFLHTQLTVTVVLFVVFIPKFRYINHPPKDGKFHSYRSGGNKTDLLDFRTQGKPNEDNGEVELDDINIAEMEPDEIRKELRRVYEQLQALKVKVMRYENPHLHSKRSQTKSKLPFYKQISRQGVKKNTPVPAPRTGEVEIDITPSQPHRNTPAGAEVAAHELEPLTKTSADAQKHSRHTDF